jgi:hypothetical protein
MGRGIKSPSHILLKGKRPWCKDGELPNIKTSQRRINPEYDRFFGPTGNAATCRVTGGK